MTIDEHIGVIEDLKSTMSVCIPDPEKTEICASLNEAIDIMRKYQKFQDQSLSLYMERLKTDLVAILEDLQLELEELPKAQFYKQNDNGDVIGCIEYPAISKGALLLIQEKINALKEKNNV